jgi:hypothetical protein
MSCGLGRPAEAEEQRRLLRQTQEALTAMTRLNGEAIDRPRDAAVRRCLAELCEQLNKPDLAAMWHRAAANHAAEVGRGGRNYFVAGRPLNCENIHLKTTLRIGDAEVGNWGLPTTESGNPVRTFNGRIDDILLFREALSPEEVRRIYERGKPCP